MREQGHQCGEQAAGQAGLMWAEAGSEYEGDAGVWLLEDRAEPEGHVDVLEPAEWRQRQ